MFTVKRRSSLLNSLLICNNSKLYFSSNNNCDIAIIGSGIMGLNVAYQLGRRTNKNVKIKLFEKAAGPGYGSTGASSAILRAIYSIKEMSMFARDSMNCYRNWNEYLELPESSVSAKFTKTGLLLFNDDLKSNVENKVDYFKTLDIKMTCLDKYLLEDTFPMINNDIGIFDNRGINEYYEKCMDDSNGMLLEDDAGYFEPVQALSDLQLAIKEHCNNVELLYNNEVTNIIYKGGSIKGLKVRDTKDNYSSEIYCNTIINCNGPWYDRIVNKMLDGLDISLTLSPVRIQVIYKDQNDIFNSEYSKKNNNVPFPIISDHLSGTYMRPQVNSKQIIVSSQREEDERDKCNPDTITPELGADPEHRDAYLNSMYHRLSPIIDPSSGSKVKSISGIYTVCEDDVHPIIGHTKLSNFWVCNGFSGHGFKCGPSVGAILAKNITSIELESDTKVPIEFYSPYRKPHKLAVKNVFA